MNCRHKQLCTYIMHEYLSMLYLPTHQHTHIHLYLYAYLHLLNIYIFVLVYVDACFKIECFVTFKRVFKFVSLKTTFMISATFLFFQCLNAML